MSHNELDYLYALALRIEGAIRDGHPQGLDGLRELESELVMLLGETPPALSASGEYSYAVDTLTDLWKAIDTERLLEGVPIEELPLLVQPGRQWVPLRSAFAPAG